LSNEQKENEFDLKNLESKIEMFKVHIGKVKKRGRETINKESPFMTEAK